MKIGKKILLNIFSSFTPNPKVHAFREASSPPERSSNITLLNFFRFLRITLTSLDPDRDRIRTTALCFCRTFRMSSNEKIMFPTCGVGGSHSWGMFSYVLEIYTQNNYVQKRSQQQIQHLQLKLWQRWEKFLFIVFIDKRQNMTQKSSWEATRSIR